MITHDRINTLKWVGGGGGVWGHTAHVTRHIESRSQESPPGGAVGREPHCICGTVSRLCAAGCSAAADPGRTRQPERCSDSKGKRKVIHIISGKTDGSIQQVILPVCFCDIVLELHQVLNLVMLKGFQDKM